MEEPAGPTSSATTLLLAKVGSMFALGFGSLLLGMLPLIIGRCRLKASEARRAITSVSSASTTLTSASTLAVDAHAEATQGLLTSLLLCFGGGVLLFTTFLHLAPEVRESVEQHQAQGQLLLEGPLAGLSLAELLFCGGFFFVYLVEEAVHAALTGKPESSETLLYRTVSVRRCNASGVAQQQQQQQQHRHRQQQQQRNKNNDNNQNNNNNGASANHNSTSGSASEAEEEVVKTPGMFVLSGPAGGGLEAGRVRGAGHGHGSPAHVESSMRSLLTVLALSFHAIFEGLAVGLEPAFSSVVYLAAAIATHKLVISFCVGMELYVAGASNRAILGYLSVFSLVTPLGIGIGLGLGHLRSDSETLGPTPTILQGMAAGTLLYVVFFEVLARERANEKSGLLQLAAILIGFTLMLGLQISTAHQHTHGHAHESHARADHGQIHDHESEDLTPNKHNYILGTAIERVTDKVADVLSTTLT